MDVGAAWPDVALAIIEFARNDTWKFILVIGFPGVILWLLFPRATHMLRNSNLSQRSDRREQKKQANLHCARAEKMLDPVTMKVVYVLASVGAYGLIRQRFMRALHEFRIEAGCEVDRLIEDRRTGERTRVALWGLADMVYRPTAPWMLVALLIVAMVLPLRSFRRLNELDSPEIAGDVKRLNLRLLVAIVSTSPLASGLVLVVLLLGTLVHQYPLGRLADSIVAFSHWVTVRRGAAIRTMT